MKNKILRIVIIFIIILGISIYFVYNYRTSQIEAQKINNIYKSYENIQILGTELTSIINQTEDINTKLDIEKALKYDSKNEMEQDAENFDREHKI